MARKIWLVCLLALTSFAVKAQDPITIKTDSTGAKVSRIDTLKPVYVNRGKIEAKRAIIRSAIIPGWGQFGNGLTFYRGVKIAAIYTGATLLTLSYIDNNNNYRSFLKELRDRQANGGKAVIGSEYYRVQTAGITAAKDTYRRNREVIIFSLIGLYGIQVVEAYVDARLKYFDIGDDLAIHIKPSIINSGTMFGYQSYVPAVKVSFKL
jgi:hypothetical protein